MAILVCAEVLGMYDLFLGVAYAFSSCATLVRSFGNCHVLRFMVALVLCKNSCSGTGSHECPYARAASKAFAAPPMRLGAHVPRAGCLGSRRLGEHTSHTFALKTYYHGRLAPPNHAHIDCWTSHCLHFTFGYVSLASWRSLAPLRRRTLCRLRVGQRQHHDLAALCVAGDAGVSSVVAWGTSCCVSRSRGIPSICLVPTL